MCPDRPQVAASKIIERNGFGDIYKDNFIGLSLLIAPYPLLEGHTMRIQCDANAEMVAPFNAAHITIANNSVDLLCGITNSLAGWNVDTNDLSCRCFRGFRAGAGDTSSECVEFFCADGTYLDTAGELCSSCPKRGASCALNELTLQNHFWFDAARLARENKELSSETEMFPCLNELACETDTVRATVHCTPGYSGVICGACQVAKGFLRSGQVCRKCETFVYNLSFVLGMGALAAMYIFYVAACQDFSAKSSDNRPVVIKIVMSFCQMLTVLGVFKARGTALFNEIVQRPAAVLGGGFSSALPIKCLMNSQIYGTFILNMVTPLLAVLATSVLIVPVWLLKRACEAMRASRPRRRAPMEKIEVTQCCRRAATATWERDTWLLNQKRKERQPFEPAPRFVAVLVFVLFGVYPTLVKSIFSIFRCSELIGGLRFLEDDYTGAYCCIVRVLSSLPFSPPSLCSLTPVLLMPYSLALSLFSSSDLLDGLALGLCRGCCRLSICLFDRDSPRYLPCVARKSKSSRRSTLSCYGEMMSGPLSLVPLLRSRSLALSLSRSLALSPPRASVWLHLPRLPH